MADIMNTTLGFQIAKVNLVEVFILTHLSHYIMQLQHFLTYTFIKTNLSMSKSVRSAEKSGQLDQLRIQFRPQSVVFPKCCIFKELYFPSIKALYFQARRPHPGLLHRLVPYSTVICFTASVGSDWGIAATILNFCKFQICEVDLLLGLSNKGF